MKTTPLIWGASGAASIGLHVAAAGLLALAIEPGEIPDQAPPPTEMQLSTYQVERSQAREATPDGENLQSKGIEGVSTAQSSIPSSNADPLGLPTSDVPASLAPTDTLGPQIPVAATMRPAQPDTQSARPLDITKDAVSDIALKVSAPLITSLSDAPTLAVSEVQPVLAVLTTLDAAPTRPEPINPTQRAETGSEIAAPLTVTVALQPDLQPLEQAAAQTDTATSVAPPQTRAKATLAFPGTGDGPIDPVSLQAFQSFMQPNDPSGSAAEIRDGISNVLSAVPCSRVQARFDPDVNALILTGHVPEDALRGTVLSAMQTQMGTDIPVREDLLILPRPQCGALAGIATVGLPQSTDQITNPLLVGEDTHAVEFRYVEGQALVLDLQGADYDAFVYVDYFDADGNVLHLAPNEVTPLTKTPAKTALRIGSDRVLAPGEPGLYIKIGPPYGQEIAVAFASSVPLYEGTRPLVEPADAYLDWLRSRVSQARSDHDDFKGEWVYFFVSTAEN